MYLSISQDVDNGSGPQRQVLLHSRTIAVAMLPRMFSVVDTRFLFESASRAFSAGGRSPKAGVMNLAVLMISATLLSASSRTYGTQSRKRNTGDYYLNAFNPR